MEGAFFLFVILAAFVSLASEYVKSVNNVGKTSHGACEVSSTIRFSEKDNVEGELFKI